MQNEEKKVEYLELVYDLMFVYIIGRNNSLIHHVQDGFISGSIYLTYLVCSVIALFIWYQTTLFINRYGTNGRLEHIGIFINMYLLYYMAQGTRVDWQGYYTRYNVAWGLIVLNLAGMYLYRRRVASKNAPWEMAQITSVARTLLIMAGMIFVSVPVYYATGLPLSPLVLVYGLIDSIVSRNVNQLVAVDFSHLTERVMLYVVFTFGEMIIGISGYFGGGITPWSVFFSLMAFLIVVGLFLSYGFFYDHIIDREAYANANIYMQIHIFLIVALNNITTAMEFMQEEEVAVIPKNIMLVASFLVYFLFLFLLEGFAKKKEQGNRRLLGLVLLLSLMFVGLMVICYLYPHTSITVSVLYVYAMFGLVYWFRESIKK